MTKGRILVADDDPQMQLALKAGLTRSGWEVVVAGDGRSALETVEKGGIDLVISDQRMPHMTGQELLAALQKQGFEGAFVMITAHGTISQAVEAMQLGAADFIAKPFSMEDLERILERVTTPEHRSARTRPRGQRTGRPIITNDALMIRVLEVAEAVARSDATVLVQGESGTGKELIARLVHSSSSRASGPFVAVNCAALPDTLLESELFGHEKGAFTGAQQRKLGKFELAHGGTILLDEVSEMELPLQAKLLRVLQEREVDRVGGRDPIPIDVRVVATTNRNLEETVRQGLFRADLYYRLNVIPLTLPALRERRGDIRLLAEHFMRMYLGERAPRLPEEVLRALQGYPWPGNVRELQNAIERAAILSAGATPKEADFLLGAGGSLERPPPQPIMTAEPQPPPAASAAGTPNGGAPSAFASHGFTPSVSTPAPLRSQISVEQSPLVIRSGTTVHEMERSLILETLRVTRQNRTEAAKLLGISIRTLRNKLHEYREAGIEIEGGND